MTITMTWMFTAKIPARSYSSEKKAETGHSAGGYWTHTSDRMALQWLITILQNGDRKLLWGVTGQPQAEVLVCCLRNDPLVRKKSATSQYCAITHAHTHTHTHTATFSAQTNCPDLTWKADLALKPNSFLISLPEVFWNTVHTKQTDDTISSAGSIHFPSKQRPLRTEGNCRK